MMQESGKMFIPWPDYEDGKSKDLTKALISCRMNLKINRRKRINGNFLKPLGMGAVAAFIGIVLLWLLIPEYKRRPEGGCSCNYYRSISHARGGSRNDCSDDDDASRNPRNSLAAKIVAADFTKFSFSWRKSHSKMTVPTAQQIIKGYS